MKKSLPLFMGRLLFHGFILIFRVAFISFWLALDFIEYMMKASNKDEEEQVKPTYYEFDASGVPYNFPQLDQMTPANPVNHDPSERGYWW